MSALTLYCLPYSGASAMVYRRWTRKLPSWLKIQPVELPGRGMRLDEPLQTGMETLIEQLAREISQGLTQPYALFGHSLGALLAFELAHALPQLGCLPPVVLFASGTAAPTRRDEYDDDLSVAKTDTELMDKLREMEGTSEEVLANKELMDFTLPILRADFLLCGAYNYAHQARLNCPLYILGGDTDEATDEQLRAWQEETSADSSVTLFTGGHFFIHEQEKKVLQFIQTKTEELLNTRTNKYFQPEAGGLCFNTL